MFNKVTDRFKLVRTEVVRAIPGFGRTISSVENYSLEVFWRDEHLGSVRMGDQESAKMKVYNGDIIFWINLGAQEIPVVGSLTTSDKYIRIYDVTLDLVVSDPVTFVKRYRLSQDPVKMAIDQFKLAFQAYASRTEHDKLSSFKHLSEAWNKQLCDDTGVKILQINWWSLQGDPRHEAAMTIQQEMEKKKKSVEANAEIQKLENRLKRQLDAEQKTYDREEDTRQHLHKLHGELRETAAQELTDILRERIRYTFEGGTSIDAVAEDSLKLLNAFHESLHRGFVESTLVSGSSASTNDASSEEASTNGTSPPKEGTTTRDDPDTNPLSHTPLNLADLSRKREKEAEEE